MARIYGSEMSGKLGDMIYSSWHGRPYSRRRPEKVANPQTEAQQAHRNAFAEISRLASDLKAAHCIGLHKQAQRLKLNTHCVFKKFNKDYYGENGIIYPRVIVSDGPVRTTRILSVELGEQNVLCVAFDNRCSISDADDQFFLFVYCPDLRAGVLVPPVPRSAGMTTVTLPAEFTEHPLHLYAFFRDEKRKTSRTIYHAITK